VTIPYYSFGLKISGISSKKMPDEHEGMVDNKYLYNDKELFDDGDWGWLDYGFRNYDAQIGRFPQLDPLTWDYPELTNYQYASNDPIANIDMDGLEGFNALFTGSGNAAATVAEATVSTVWRGAKTVVSSPSFATRIFGGLKAIGGALEIAAGSALVASGVGAVLGAGLIIHGADVTAAGVMQTIRGTESRTFTEQGISKGLQFAGVSGRNADNIAGWTDMGLSLGGGLLANSYKLTTRIVANSPKVRIIELAKEEVKQFSNAEVRQWYKAQVKNLNTKVAATEKNAMSLHAQRNVLKAQARNMMADRKTAALLEKTDPIRPFKFYVDKYAGQGYSGKSLWERIIKGSTTSNAEVNSRFEN
jgi:RHS repeat-associated protein